MLECVVKEIVMLFVRKMDFCAKCQINHQRKIKREDSYKAVAVGIKNTWAHFFTTLQPSCSRSNRITCHITYTTVMVLLLPSKLGPQICFTWIKIRHIQHCIQGVLNINNIIVVKFFLIHLFMMYHKPIIWPSRLHGRPVAWQSMFPEMDF